MRLVLKLLILLIIIVAIALLLALLGGWISIGGLGGSPSPVLSSEQVKQIQSACDEITKKMQGPSSSSKATWLREAKSAALAQPNVEWAKIGNSQLIVKFKEGGEAIWLLNSIKVDSLKKITTLNSMTKNIGAGKKSLMTSSMSDPSDIAYAEQTTNYRNGRSKPGELRRIALSTLDAFDTPLFAAENLTNAPSKNAVIINSLAKDPSKDIRSLSDILHNNFKGLLENCNYTVAELNGPDASPEQLKTLANFSLVIMFGHGSPENFQTGRPWQLSDFNKDWQDGKIVWMCVPWGDPANPLPIGGERLPYQHKVFCAVTGKFWKDAYARTHLQNALFMNLACYGSTDEDYRQALFDVGVSAYTGWSDRQGIAPASAFKMLSLMTEGKTLQEAAELLENKLRLQTQPYEGRICTAELWYGPPGIGYSWKLDCVKNNKESIRAIDFLNHTYPPSPYLRENGFDQEINVKNGEFNTQDTFYCISKKIIYCDLNNDGNEDAVVWSFCGLNISTYSYNEFMVYTFIGGKEKLLGKIDDDVIRQDYNKYYNSPNDMLGDEVKRIYVIDNILVFERNTDGPRCCPQHLTKFEYKWNGTSLALVKQPERNKNQ